MDETTEPQAPVGIPTAEDIGSAPKPKPLKVCKRCGGLFPLLGEHHKATGKFACIPVPEGDALALAARLHGEEVIAAVHAEAQDPETDDQ